MKKIYFISRCVFITATFLLIGPSFVSAQVISDLKFGNSTMVLLESRFFEDPSNFDRSVVTCGDWDCFDSNNERDLGPLSIHYCDLTKFPEGCIRRWEDQSGHISSRSNMFPGELLTGRDIGQDDLEKPGIIMDCINGHPCIRGGSDYRDPDGNVHPDLYQNASMDMENADEFRFSGEFSLIMLFRPVIQDAIDGDAVIFGHAHNGVWVDMADSCLYMKFGGGIPVKKLSDKIEINQWHFLEVHMDNDGNLEAYVNGVKTSAPSLSVTGGWIQSGNIMSNSKGWKHFMGDLALLAVYNENMIDMERQIARNYVKKIYNVPAITGVDHIITPEFNVTSESFQNGMLTINITTNKQSDIQLTVFNLQGVKIANSSFKKVNTGINTLQLTLPEVAKGIYIYQIVSDQNAVSVKFHM